MLQFKYFISILLVGILISCQEKSSSNTLKIYGPSEVSANGDTTYYTVPDFEFTNCDGTTITQKDFEGKVYVADFFFTSCRTICPVMKKEMVRIQEAYPNNDKLKLLSHTLDPKVDTPEKLTSYAEALGADLEQWYFVTGSVDDIYDMAEKGYFTAALMDASQPDGITHSGRLVLVDEQRHIRGFYEGTDPDEVDRLIEDLKLFLNE